MSEPKRLTEEELVGIRQRLEMSKRSYWSGYGLSTAEFLTHARADIPALIAHIAAQEAEIKQLRAEIATAAHFLPVAGRLSERVQAFKTHYSQIVEAQEAENRQLAAEVVRLMEALREEHEVLSLPLYLQTCAREILEAWKRAEAILRQTNQNSDPP